MSDLSDEFTVTTPIDGSGPFSLVQFSGTEGLSRLFQFQLELISSNTAVAASDLVGLGVTLGISSGLDASYRPFHGIVSRLVSRRSTRRCEELRAPACPLVLAAHPHRGLPDLPEPNHRPDRAGDLRARWDSPITSSS